MKALLRYFQFLLLLTPFSAWGQISGETVLCPGVQKTYSIVDPEAYRITWHISGGTFSGLTVNKTTVNATFTSNGSLTVKIYEYEPEMPPPHLVLRDTWTKDITVKIAGNINGSSSVCPNGSFTLRNIDNGSPESYVIEWQSSPSGQNNWTYLTQSARLATITTSTTANTDYRVVVPGCTINNISPIKTVNVFQPTLNAGAIGSSQSVCAGATISLTNVTNASASGNFSYQWQKRYTGGGWSDIAEATSHQYSETNITQTTDYQRVIKWSCDPSVSSPSNVVTVQVDQPTIGGTASAQAKQVCGSGTVAVSLSGSRGSVQGWYYQYNDGSGYTAPQSFNSLTGLAVTSVGLMTRTYKIYASVKNGECAATDSNPDYITVYSISTGSTPSPLMEGYGLVSGSLVASGYAGNFLRWQQSTDNVSWIDVTTSPSYPVSVPYNSSTAFVSYRAYFQNGPCSFYSAPAIVKAYPVPFITYSGSPSLSVGSSLVLQSNTVYHSYQWMKNGSDITGATSSTYTATEPGEYALKVKGSATAPIGTSAPLKIYPLGQQPANPHNSIVNTIIRKEGVTSSTNIYSSLSVNDYSQAVTYADGLNRPLQQIAIGQSPTQKDIVQALEYDTTQIKTYLPFSSATRDGLYKINALVKDNSYLLSDQYLYYQQTGSNLPTSQYPYAITVPEKTPLGRVKEQGSPGQDWQPGNGHTIRHSFRINSNASGAPAVLKDVKVWSASGPSGFYADGKLTVTQTIDENNNEVWLFTDMRGKEVLKRVQYDRNLEGQHVAFLETYYVYDNRGNLVLQVPPKAVLKLNSGTAWSSSFRDEWCFVYVYDGYDRIVEKKSPGAAPLYYGYDPLSRLVLMQDGLLRADKKWLFVKYDYQNRPVITGIYTNTVDITRTAVQANVLDVLYPNLSDVSYESPGTAMHGYTNSTFPTSATQILTVNYYSHYDFDQNGSDDFSYTTQGLPWESSRVGSSFGMLTGSKKAILGTSDWLYEYIFYDQKGNVIQTRANNHLRRSVIDNLITIVYDFEGKVLRKKSSHHGSTQVTTLDKYDYDHAGRLIRITQSIDGGTDKVLVQNNYNELGQLVGKDLHQTSQSAPLAQVDPAIGQPGVRYNAQIVVPPHNGEHTLIASQMIKLQPGFAVSSGSSFTARIGYTAQDAAIHNSQISQTFLQSIDYRYNIRGWLESINNAKLSVDSRNNDANDYFGMEYVYNTQVSGVTNTPQYNGNISAVKWKHLGDREDNKDQRISYYQYDKADQLLKSEFAKNDGLAWTKEVGTLNETFDYDANGNIVKLLRHQNQRTASGLTVGSIPQLIDDLVYTYPSGNGNKLAKVTDATANMAGFKSGSSDNIQYAYNDDGSLTVDKNKGIDSIHYNILGKIRRIKFADGKVVSYAYDASGNKIAQKIQSSGGTSVTDYVSNFVYENGSLSFFGSPEGRVVKNASGFEYQYAISDHQGNTRVLFTSITPTSETIVVDFESPSNSTVNNYPTGGSRSGLSAMNKTHGGTSSQLLHGGHNSQVGISKSFKVFPGDKVKIEAFAKYTNPISTNSALAAYTSALLSAFNTAPPLAGEVGTRASALNYYGSVVARGDGPGTSEFPKAFVNILLFDKDYKFLDIAYDQINGGNHSNSEPHDLMSREYVVKEAGYAFVYISNENPTEVPVYFDDITISHTPTNIIQYNEYYAFGSSNARSWTRDNNKNDFLYNDGSELNGATGWYETFHRSYDPVLGRFMQVDPKSDRFASITPYNYGFNDPVYWNDPSGAEPPGGQSYYQGSPVYVRNWYGEWEVNSNLRPLDIWYIEERGGGMRSPSERINAADRASRTSDWLMSMFSAAPDGTVFQRNRAGQWGYHDTRVYMDSDGVMVFNEIFIEGAVLAFQGGVYTINQVLAQYGYPSREQYLFPTPSVAERLLNFGIPLDREDLAEKVAEAVTGEWDLIHQNIQAVDLDKLRVYKSDLRTLRWNLMTRVELLNFEIAQLREDNPGGIHNSQIIGLTRWRWDLEDQLIPVNFEMREVGKAINSKTVK
jgi:RHS repeat-associated protein